MTYKDTGFRAFYRNFCVLPMADNLKSYAVVFDEGEDATCLLTYGYVDEDEGLMLEVLAVGFTDDEGYHFYDPSDEPRTFIPIREVINNSFVLLDDKDDTLRNRYEKKLALLEKYEPSEDLEKSRMMEFLDGCRDISRIDEVVVFLTKDRLEVERVHARILGLGDHCFIAKLLDEPKQDFGYHKGDKIAFFLQESKEGRVQCCCNMNPSRRLTKRELEGGHMLHGAVSKFMREKTDSHAYDVLEILRDSDVWIPYQKNVPFPDLLEKGDELFLPIFSSAEEMGQYGEHFYKIEKNILQAIELTKKSEESIRGIVLNPFTQAFVINKELYDMILNMKSCVEE